MVRNEIFGPRLAKLNEMMRKLIAVPDDKIKAHLDAEKQKRPDV